MSIGPVQVIEIGFAGNEFNGAILPELERLIENGIITLIDGLLVLKSADGDVDFVEFDQEGLGDVAANLARLSEQLDALISDEDVEALADGLEPNTSAAILVFEHTWSKPLRDAIVASGGYLAADFLVPGQALDELLGELGQLED